MGLAERESCREIQIQLLYISLDLGARVRGMVVVVQVWWWWSMACTVQEQYEKPITIFFSCDHFHPNQGKWSMSRIQRQHRIFFESLCLLTDGI